MHWHNMMNAYIPSSPFYKYDELMEVTFERDKWIIKDGGTQTKGDEQISSGNGKTPLSFTKQYQPRSLHSIELQYVQCYKQEFVVLDEVQNNKKQND